MRALLLGFCCFWTLHGAHGAPSSYKSVSDLPLKTHWRVRYWIRYFQNDGRIFFQKFLSRSYRYVPKWQKVFKEQNLPKDLAYVSMMESGFSSKAVSHANAVGYWQFISSTGKKYGLQKSWWIDERKDYMKSTKAAARYFKALYSMFHSWELALAAYNMGENRLTSLIKKHRTRNYWILSNKSDFPQETRNYVPKIFASILLSKFPKLYGFHNVKKLKPLSYKKVWVPGGTALSQISSQLNTPLSTLKKLNPALIKAVVPSWQKKGFWIRIPKNRG